MKPFGTRSKFNTRYTGPAKIVQILSPVSFIVKDKNSQQFQVHSNTLKRVYPRW